MPSLLLTAFEPYDRWTTNASELALAELMRDPPISPQIVTRLFPVDFETVKASLPGELAADFDYVLHLGQAPRSTKVQLEAIGLNIGRDAGSDRARPLCGDGPLCDDGPLAYRSSLPLDDWADRIRAAGIPAEVSYHAGTYLCNAALYLTHYYCERMGLRTRAAFIHLPLDASQIVGESPDIACLPTALSAAAIAVVLDALAGK